MHTKATQTQRQHRHRGNTGTEATDTEATQTQWQQRQHRHRGNTDTEATQAQRQHRHRGNTDILHRCWSGTDCPLFPDLHNYILQNMESKGIHSTLVLVITATSSRLSFYLFPQLFEITASGDLKMLLVMQWCIWMPVLQTALE